MVFKIGDVVQIGISKVTITGYSPGQGYRVYAKSRYGNWYHDWYDADVLERDGKLAS